MSRKSVFDPDGEYLPLPDLADRRFSIQVQHFLSDKKGTSFMS